jgi:hypothetical protein
MRLLAEHACAKESEDLLRHSDRASSTVLGGADIQPYCAFLQVDLPDAQRQ